MNIIESIGEREHRAGVVSLWLGWILAPTWWLAQFEIRYAAVRWACEHGRRGAVAEMGAAAVAIAVAIMLGTLCCHRASKAHASMRFVSVGGIWVSAAFALLTSVQLLPDVYIDLCRL